MATNNVINLPTAATGSIVIGQGVGTAFSTLALGTIPGTSPIYDGTALSYYNPLQAVRFIEDFFTTNSGNPAGYWLTATANGGGVTWPGAVIDNGHPGIVNLTTGTAGNGSAALSSGSGSTTVGNLILGGGVIDLYMVFNLSALSDGTNTYECSIGLGDSRNSPNTSFTNGVFFNYSSTVNSGNWQGSTSAAASKSVVNGSVAAASGWTTLHININAAATLATYYVNGVSIGTVNSNFPTTTINPIFSIAASAGSTSRTLAVDLVYMYQQLTNPR